MASFWQGFITRFSVYFTTSMVYSYLIRIVQSVIVILISHIVIKITNRVIDNILKDNNKISARKSNTLRMLLKSVVRYGIYFIALLIILSLFNVFVTSLLAGAGILGVALGFGAQNLIKDIINGFFIIFEDEFGVGDYIETAGVSGLVEEIGLRTTKIRSFGGELHIIPNSEISKVTNYSTGTIRVLVDVNVAHEENLTEVIEILKELCQEILQEKKELITEGPKVLGVQELSNAGSLIRIWAKAVPMEQWQLARYIRQRVKERLTKKGIAIAYPHMVILTKGEKKERNLTGGISDE